MDQKDKKKSGLYIYIYIYMLQFLHNQNMRFQFLKILTNVKNQATIRKNEMRQKTTRHEMKIKQMNKDDGVISTKERVLAVEIFINIHLVNVRLVYL